MVGEKIAAMAERVMEGEMISREQADWLAALGSEHLYDLFRGASRIRERFFANRVRCCSIASVRTGRCGEDCAFCSQSAHFKTHVSGCETLEDEVVLAAAKQAAGSGAGAFGLVASGYGPGDADIERWGGVIRQIRDADDTGVCASFGVIGEKQVERLAALGVQCYNHNLQTSRRHFPNIISTHGYDDRLATLRHLKAAGIRVCSGALFGMGETWADRLDLAFELRDLGVHVVPLNFLIPIDGTPLAGSAPLEPMQCLKIIAVYRFCLPTQEIKIAGGRERNLRDLQSWIFFAGADSFLIGNYLTTIGRSAEDDRRMVADLGLLLVDHHGAERPMPGQNAGLSMKGVGPATSGCGTSGDEPASGETAGHIALPVLTSGD